MRNGISKYFKTSIITITAMIVIASTLVIAWHDGIGQITPISDINSGRVSIGTIVTIKGNLSQLLQDAVLGYLHPTIVDANGSLMFSWRGVAPELYSIVIVRGTVVGTHYLRNVTFFDSVWVS
jgi:hypothetical protein